MWVATRMVESCCDLGQSVEITRSYPIFVSSTGSQRQMKLNGSPVAASSAAAWQGPKTILGKAERFQHFYSPAPICFQQKASHKDRRMSFRSISTIEPTLSAME